MHFTAERKGNVYCENSFQDRFLEKIYCHKAGRIFLKPFLLPVFSKAGGKLLDSAVSRIFITPFIRSHSIDMREYDQRKYGKVAELFEGGYIWVFRLSVEDYHRYIYVDNGKVSDHIRIPGIFHTVNPVANDCYPIYKENTREYSLLRSENFGLVLQMEVGALMVGKIENKPGNKKVQRGEEKGNFAFGGSTVILMTQKNKVCPDKDILKYSVRGIETKVKMGESVGRRMICRDAKK